ncbi:hypothetical protein [Burkholderia sp. TSV86]|uniref:hypothetical protein n=1 Tax=Burkholderia sp. TSV86 TaxID=1385594 RepID=UPI001E4FF557|nr:hypothetical protein [Burkholderia sp. TSV86]
MHDLVDCRCLRRVRLQRRREIVAARAERRFEEMARFRARDIFLLVGRRERNRIKRERTGHVSKLPYRRAGIGRRTEQRRTALSKAAADRTRNRTDTCRRRAHWIKR